MKLSTNPTFIRHKSQIEQALMEAPESVRSTGELLYKDMLVCADQLDSILEFRNGVRASPASIGIRRDEFHKKCRDLGDWLSVYAPNLELKWD